MEQLRKDTNICSDDIIRTFISRRVLPLQRRAHKISEMYSPRDPTKITGLPLSKEDIVLKARQIWQTDMPMDWEWGFLPLSSTNPPTREAKERFPRIATEERGPCRKRDLDKVDPNPYVHWTELKMGGTHASRPDAPSASANPQVVDHVTPLQAEVGQEFLDKLASQGKKNKAPVTEAGSSHAPPAKRARQEVVGGKTVSKKHYRRREMPVASGAVLKISKSATGMRPESSEEAARTSSPPQASPVPSGAETQDTGASNTGADTKAAERAEPQVPPAPKKKKKRTPASSPSKTVPDSSVPASSAPAQDAPNAPAPPKTAPVPPATTFTGEPAAAKPTPPPSQGPAAATSAPPEGTKLSRPKPASAATAASSGPQSLILHAGHAAIVAGETASAQLGRITELTRGGTELGHLLDYAEKWNQADESPATRGLGNDKMTVID
nr:formin-like protein 16 [Lolium perenne]